MKLSGLGDMRFHVGTSALHLGEYPKRKGESGLLLLLLFITQISMQFYTKSYKINLCKLKIIIILLYHS